MNQPNKNFASLKRKCIDCKKTLVTGAYYVDSKGPYCNRHSLARQAPEPVTRLKEVVFRIGNLVNDE